MKADSVKLLAFLEQGQVIFDIPVFQRNYEWQTKQCQQLFDDLPQLIDHGGEHFIGTFVYVHESKNTEVTYRIIDGQQRLTSCMLLLKAMADTVTDQKSSEETVTRYLKNSFRDENQHWKLKPVERDRDAFYAVMNGTIPEYEGTSKIIENYNFFKDCLVRSTYSIDALLMAMRNLSIVYIELDNDVQSENPQVIFESLNSTGVSLSPTDLVRNFLLMRVDVNLQASLYRNYWLKIEALFSSDVFTEFLRHYLISKMHVLVKRDNVYQTYKDYYTQNQLTTTDALKELYQYARYYYNLLFEATDSSAFNHVLSHVNVMDKKVIYPYLMKLLDMQQNENLDWKQAIKILQILESFLFRRAICNVASNGLNRLVISLLKKQRNDPELKFVTDCLLASNFPVDSQVREALLTLDIYGKRRSIAKLALELLEEHRSKETINFDDAQVEHIMPQSLTNDWKIEVNNAETVNEQYGGTLGNLTLTKYNQEMSNKLFEQKRDYYLTSNISLTRAVATKFKHWEKDDIIVRTKQLGDELVEILERPKDVVVKPDYQGEHMIDEDISVTGTKPLRLTIDSQDYVVASWRAFLLTFLNYAWNYDSAAFLNLKQNASLGQLFNERGFRSPAKLDSGLEVETNFSANSILAIVAKIADLYGIPEFVTFTIKWFTYLRYSNKSSTASVVRFVLLFCVHAEKPILRRRCSKKILSYMLYFGK